MTPLPFVGRRGFSLKHGGNSSLSRVPELELKSQTHPNSLNRRKQMAKVQVNISQEIRNLLTENPAMTSKEVLKILLAKHPKLNKNSFSVAFYTSRKKLSKSSIQRHKPTRVHTKDLNYGILTKTVDFINSVNGTHNAIEAIKSVQELQIVKK